MNKTEQDGNEKWWIIVEVYSSSTNHVLHNLSIKLYWFHASLWKRCFTNFGKLGCKIQFKYNFINLLHLISLVKFLICGQSEWKEFVGQCFFPNESFLRWGKMSIIGIVIVWPVMTLGKVLLWIINVLNQLAANYASLIWHYCSFPRLSKTNTQLCTEPQHSQLSGLSLTFIDSLENTTEIPV